MQYNPQVDAGAQTEKQRGSQNDGPKSPKKRNKRLVKRVAWLIGNPPSTLFPTLFTHFFIFSFIPQVSLSFCQRDESRSSIVCTQHRERERERETERLDKKWIFKVVLGYPQFQHRPQQAKQNTNDKRKETRSLVRTGYSFPVPFYILNIDQ
jgi:hypothetical protein